MAQRLPRRWNYVRFAHLLPHLIYFYAIPCETQMLQIVTLRGGYLYRIAYFASSIQQRVPRGLIIL